MANRGDGEVLNGQLYDRKDDLVIQYTQQMRNAGNATAENLGDARTEIVPNSQDSSRVTIFTAPTAALDAIVHSYPTTINVELPDTLVSITASYNSLKGEGVGREDNTAFTSGTSGSLNVDLRGSGQSSFSIIADIIADISNTSARGRDVPATEYFFYMPSPVTQGQILARLLTITGQTVNTWPRFTPKVHVLTAKGQQMNLRVGAHVNQSWSFSPSNTSGSTTWGDDYSWDGGVTVRTYTLPPLIHGPISITSPVQQGSAIATAYADVVGGENFPPKRVEITKTIGPLTASVTPSFLAATTPSAIPSSGLYLYRSDAENHEFGYMKVRAIVVNFANV